MPLIAVFALATAYTCAHGTEDHDDLSLLQHRVGLVANETAGCIAKVTRLADNGDAKIWNLQYHTLECDPDTAMKQWRMSRGGTQTQIQFHYTCCPIYGLQKPCTASHCTEQPFRHGNSAAQRKHPTGLHAGHGENFYLDRHNPTCMDSQQSRTESLDGFQNYDGIDREMVMTKWTMDASSSSQYISIKFDCAQPGDDPTGGIKNCQPYATPLNEDGAGRSEYLDRHNVECPAYKFMTQWHLSRGGTTDQIHFKYTCCDSSIPAPTPSPTAPTPAPGHGYITTNKNVNQCPAGSRAIASTQECHSAQKLLGKGWMGSVGYTGYPSGCWASDTWIGFNLATNNPTAPLIRLICKQEPPPTNAPTPLPTEVPTSAPSSKPTPPPTPLVIDQADLDDDEKENEVSDEQEDVYECASWCYSKKHKSKPWVGGKCDWYACRLCDECLRGDPFGLS